MKKILWVLIMVFGIIGLVGCESSADRVSYNLHKEVEEFRVLRRISAINGITDKPVFELVGYCSIETDDSKAGGTMEIVCKTGMDSYTKDFVYLSDNIMIHVQQLEGVDVPQYHKQMIFAPQSLLPIPEIVGDRIGE